MLDVCLLGTGGMMPLPYRWLTSCMARYNGHKWNAQFAIPVQIEETKEFL